MANRCKDAKDSQEHEMNKEQQAYSYDAYCFAMLFGAALFRLFEFKRIMYADLSVNNVVRFLFTFNFFFSQVVCEESRKAAMAATLLIATKPSSNAHRGTRDTSDIQHAKRKYCWRIDSAKLEFSH